jgi:hypothetical protein
MDDRISVEEVVDWELGTVQIVRNAGEKLMSDCQLLTRLHRSDKRMLSAPGRMGSGRKEVDTTGSDAQRGDGRLLRGDPGPPNGEL